MEKFKCILADPPWQFPNETLWQRPQSKPSRHYSTLTLNEIKSLPVETFVDDNALLWLWTPTYHLIRGWALEVVEAWGFRPITTLVWCKVPFGLGYYLRNAHEQILLGVKGSVKFKVKDQSSWFVAKRSRHSKKPEESYTIIERVSHEPRLELFAATQREGWTCWGDEVGDPLNIGFDPEKWQRD